jgi:hypothetical protein
VSVECCVCRSLDHALITKRIYTECLCVCVCVCEVIILCVCVSVFVSNCVGPRHFKRGSLGPILALVQRKEL